MSFRKTILLAADQQQSVLNALDSNERRPIAYTPYGHRPLENGLLSLLGFNGELPDLLTGHYHLGNGYRQFNPILMRFNSPDNWSPFGAGGVNAYAYCDGDPRNKRDPTGHISEGLKAFFRQAGLIGPSITNKRIAETQRNTQWNVSNLVPMDNRPPEIFNVQQHLEIGRQRHVSNLMSHPDQTSLRPTPKIALQSQKLTPARKAYSTLALAHHNKDSTPSPMLPPPNPKVTFSDQAERLVEDPKNVWTKVQELRK